PEWCPQRCGAQHPLCYSAPAPLQTLRCKRCSAARRPSSWRESCGCVLGWLAPRAHRVRHPPSSLPLLLLLYSLSDSASAPALRWWRLILLITIATHITVAISLISVVVTHSRSAATATAAKLDTQPTHNGSPRGARRQKEQHEKGHGQHKVD